MVSITFQKYWIYALAVFFITLFLAPPSAKAQINPPDLLCVKNDTLFWNPPVSLCGTFINYSIFISNNINGPYSTLATINNAGQTQFYNPNGNGNVWYYFMQTNAICPGQPILSSDTLDSNPPIKGLTKHVSVVGNDVLLEWESSPSPETSGYIIYRETQNGTTVIATVGNVLSYTDTGASPNTNTETYYIVAIDDCGQTSLFGDSNTTIFVDTMTNACSQSIDLDWNLYQNWVNGIDHQEVWVGINGDPAQVVATLSATDTTYTYTGLNDGDIYCVSIKAFHLNRPDIATSNEVCFTADVVQPVQTFILTNASFDADNNIFLQWFWNVSAEVNAVVVENSLDGSSFTTQGTYVPPMPMIQAVTQDLGSYAGVLGSQHFRLESIDLCDSLQISNKASTIFLTGSPNTNHTNFVNWNTPYIEGATLLSYELHSERFGGWQLTATLDPTELSYTDAIDVTEDSEFNVCYYVVGVYEYVLPNGSTQTIRSRSNTICVEQFSTIFAPNAFAPYGLNNVFKPLVLFGEKVDFNMKIYNRYGELMYESKSILDGWDGKKNNKIANQGLYSYVITVVQPSGREIVEKGYLTLLH